MQIKLFVLSAMLITAVLSFGGLSPASAQTTSTQAQIDALLLQINQLTAQLQTLQNQRGATQTAPVATATAPTATTAWCHTFNSNLGYAQSGTAEVGELHTALQKQGISYAPDAGNIYADGTGLGVVQFQEKYNIIPKSGYVGSLTRAKLNFLYGCGTTLAPAATPSSVSSAAVTPPASSTQTTTPSSAASSVDSSALSLCGNSLVDAGEECDDGNILNADGCDMLCMKEFMCNVGGRLFGGACWMSAEQVSREEQGPYADVFLQRSCVEMCQKYGMSYNAPMKQWQLASADNCKRSFFRSSIANPTAADLAGRSVITSAQYNYGCAAQIMYTAGAYWTKLYYDQVYNPNARGRFASESCPCTPQPANIVCDSFTYSDWSACPVTQYYVDRYQTRTLVSSSPTGCSGGQPILRQPCSNPACTSFDYTDWSPATCPSSGTQTRAVTAMPDGCTGGTPLPSTQSCTPATTTTCTYTYDGNWSPPVCPASGTQIRTVTAAPAGCTGGTPLPSTQSCTPLPADLTFGFGQASTGWLSIAGDWDGDGTTTIGLYNPTASTFMLRSTNTTGAADLTFGFGSPGAGWLPIAGDWDGTGGDSIGLYNPATSIFYLRNTNTAGAADLSFGFGEAGWLPIAGDWNGDGKATVGLYNPTSSIFYLRNTNTAGAADITLGFGSPGAGWLPIVGNWDGVGGDSIGLYDPATSTFYLRNSNTTGAADITFGYGSPNAGWKPIAGDWDRNGTTKAGLYNGTTSTFYLKGSNAVAAADNTAFLASVSNMINQIAQLIKAMLGQ